VVPKFCRMAWRVDDIDMFTQTLGELLGLRFFTPGIIAELYPDAGFKVMFGEHGVEPIQPGPEGLAFAEGDRLIEIAVDVAVADSVLARMTAAGHHPIATSFLPVPAVNEYLFGRDFHGIQFLACTEGVNEAQVRSELPFDTLDDAAPPKIGCVTVVSANINALAADLRRFYDMEFHEIDPAGLGHRALSGTHRVRLIEGPSAVLDGLGGALASVDIIHADVEGARRKLEAAGYPVRHRRPLATGGYAYYFGETIEGFPISIYPVSADSEILGLA
jgi:hypothetical protein